MTPGGAANSNWENGEHAGRVIDDMAGRNLPNRHTIVFANEKGGVGKTTLAFHTAIALSNRGYRVLAIDLDARQRSLARTIENRHGAVVCLGLDLPTPKCSVLDRSSGAMLSQEILRLGAQCDVIIIDAPGHDVPVVRRAVAIADTLVTPVNASFFDLDVLARFDPVSHRIREAGPFARTVLELRTEQAARGLQRADWIVAKNRIRTSEKSHLARTLPQLDQIASSFGLRIAEGLRERVAYRALLQFGLTASDLAAIPQMQGFRMRDDGALARFVDGLALPAPTMPQRQPIRRYAAKVPQRTREDYTNSLQNHLYPLVGERAAIA
uniref:division plane positioning ATPase MipZ n=1 Tax=Parerythrobacter lutipelagi TaxID=1964208 RepID=UPI0010F8FB83|nr:division plane positioning ATPase MipZ [Parerythrobacter lutipelagi]